MVSDHFSLVLERVPVSLQHPAFNLTGCGTACGPKVLNGTKWVELTVAVWTSSCCMASVAAAVLASLRMGPDWEGQREGTWASFFVFCACGPRTRVQIARPRWACTRMRYHHKPAHDCVYALPHRSCLHVCMSVVESKILLLCCG